MLTHKDCFPCFLRQTIIALDRHSDSHTVQQETQMDIIREVLLLMREADISKPPSYITTLIHRLIRDRLGDDPYRKIKDTYNNIAMDLYPEMKHKVKTSEDPLLTASKLAIAGNIIDFGIFSSVDINSSITRSLEDRIAVDDYHAFTESLSTTSEILYLLDNSGEIVFDRILVEELLRLGKKVTAVVKGSPVLNDATIDDAVQSGMTSLCEVIDNGSDAVGTVLEWTSPEFQEKFHTAELIISKGQGNFETLIGTDKRTYFLFQSKCDVVSKELDLSPGSMLLKKS
jgi:damage-control phosphatase, subfamily I